MEDLGKEVMILVVDVDMFIRSGSKSSDRQKKKLDMLASTPNTLSDSLAHEWLQPSSFQEGSASSSESREFFRPALSFVTAWTAGHESL